MSAATTLEHLLPAGYPRVDGVLSVGGEALDRLAERLGQTPFFVYDRALMTARVAALRAALPPDLHIHYAMKANPHPEVVRHFVSLVDGLDVASGRELEVALAAGADPQHVSFAGPGKRDPELAAAVRAGITINVESEGELERIAHCSSDVGGRARVAVRVNPDFELKSSGMKMTGRASQFGVDAERVPAMLSRIGVLGLDFQGFHIYSGSQNLSPDALIEAACKTLELAVRLAVHAPGPVRLLNIGGGFGIPYFPGERPLDVTPIGVALQAALGQARVHLPEAEFVMEFGRFLVGEAGLYVCRVIDRKLSRGEVFLVTDGGLHHHLAASGNFGQVIRKNYPVTVARVRADGDSERVSVVGPLCTPLDLLADRMLLPRADVGDLVVVFQSGAYGPTASPAAFLSHPAALEVVL